MIEGPISLLASEEASVAIVRREKEKCKVAKSKRKGGREGEREGEDALQGWRRMQSGIPRRPACSHPPVAVVTGSIQPLVSISEGKSKNL